ncbi:MAG: HPF/RaiA family ribosome-associated protein [Blastocatellia bacterium]
MEHPVQISFRNMKTSEAVESRIHEEVAKLETFYDRIMSCRVLVETRRPAQAHGHLYHLRIEMTLPGGEIVVGREPSLHGSLRKTAEEKGHKARETVAPHRDVFLAIRDAFKSARRRLQDFARRQNGVVKQHEPVARGRVKRLAPGGDYGFLETPDGAEIYFHRHSVLNDGFDQLAPGSIVTFVEERGEKGPQASTVRLAKTPRARRA